MNNKRIEKLSNMIEKVADDVHKRSIDQYEKDIAIDISTIKTDEDFFKYVDQRIEALRAHNERYTTNLAKRMFMLYTKDE